MKPYDQRQRYGKTNFALLIEGNKHYELAASIITTGTVLDAGAGFGTLKEYLPEGVTYKGIDATQWIVDAGTNGVTFANVMNAKGKADYVIAFGILETCEDLNAMATKLKSLANVMVLSSCINRSNNNTFKAHTREDITAAFGAVEFIDGNDETFIKCVI